MNRRKFIKILGFTWDGKNPEMYYGELHDKFNKYPDRTYLKENK